MFHLMTAPGEATFSLSKSRMPSSAWSDMAAARSVISGTYNSTTPKTQIQTE